MTRSTKKRSSASTAQMKMILEIVEVCISYLQQQRPLCQQIQLILDKGGVIVYHCIPKSSGKIKKVDKESTNPSHHLVDVDKT